MKTSLPIAVVLTLFLTGPGWAQVSQDWVRRTTAITNVSSGITVSDMTIDAQSNVYVTGYAGTDSINVITAKYNAQGVVEWVWSYNDTLNSVDVVNAIHVDAAGNVYVTGYSYFGFASAWMMTYKYSPAGIQLWSRRFQVTGGYGCFGNDIAVDGSGSVYVVGTATGVPGGGGFDVLLVKYSPDSVMQWYRAFDGGSSATDEGARVEVDNAGNVVVAGSAGGSGGADFFVRKYAPDGTNLWSRRLDISGTGGDDYIRDMALDNAGNIYVTGRGNRGVDFATVKYDAFGTQQWVTTYNGPASGSDEARAIAVDNAGNVVITGSDIMGGGPPSVYSTVKYNAAGAQQWARNDHGPANGGDQAFDVAVDTAGSVYVTGQVSNTAFDVYTMKYSPSGALQWGVGYTSGGGNSLDQGRFVKVDRSGNVFVTGTAVTPFVSSDYVTIKYMQGPTSVGDEGEAPAAFSLDQNYPNPFNPSTTIRYALPVKSSVTLTVYNSLGQRVALLMQGEKEAGSHDARFDGAGLPSGTYFYRLRAGGIDVTRRMLLVK